MRLAINGFGRIGRSAFKIFLERVNGDEDVEIVAINDLAPVESLVYLLKYDSVYGVFDGSVDYTDSSLVVNGKKYSVYAEKNPEDLPWRDLEVDVVLECTGIFTTFELARKHLSAGAKKVLLSAPAKDDGFRTVVLGSGNTNLDTEFVSNASCTTNCVTPVIRVLSEKFGVEKAMLTTVHAYTSTQSLVDGPHKKDLRRGRAAAQNVVPSSTGAAKATAKAFPEMKDIFDGIALRVPVVCGSISDVTAILKRNATVEEINETFRLSAQDSKYKGILKYTEEPLVSSDIIKSPYSAIVDGNMTRVVGGNMVKVLAWYDNEWGYSNRLVDMAILLGQSIGNG